MVRRMRRRRQFSGLSGRGRLGIVAGLRAVVLAFAGLAMAMPALARDVMVPVPRVTIYPGDLITEVMLTERAVSDRDGTLPGLVAARGQIVGKVARQTLLPNKPISLTGVREDHAIKQGQPAVVIFQSGGLVISATAMPLQPGAVGDVISLRNTESGTTIRGVVQRDGSVRVGTP